MLLYAVKSFGIYSNSETHGYRALFAKQTFVEHCVSTRNIGINTYRFYNKTKIVKYTSKCRWKFCPAIGNSGVIFLRYLVPLFSGIERSHR